MKKIIGHLRVYAIEQDKRVFFLSALFIALAIYVNYGHGLNETIRRMPEGRQYLSWFGVFFLVFSFAYVLRELFQPKGILKQPKFLILLLLAPALFAWKMSATYVFPFSENRWDNDYWNQVFYWPFKLLVVTAVLIGTWRLFDRDQPLYGYNHRNFSFKPYLGMLLVMVPLVAAASTQPDFLQLYPKLKSVLHQVPEEEKGWRLFLYELSYGSDFFTIELFFRGFLVLAFARWVGKDAILPMALFYCSIHFGKPLGECISSFFGGLLLGVVTYHTRSIWGGLIVHLGIAWLMELGGYLGNLYRY